MLTFNREQTQDEKDRREARYKAMTEEELRSQVSWFTRELKIKRMKEFEQHLKTNSLRYAMMELHKRGLFVEPVILSTQKKKPDFRVLTHEIDMKKIEGHMTKILVSKNR